MEIKKVIEYMEGLLKAGEEDVIIGWWDRETVCNNTEHRINKDQFVEIADIIDNGDWSSINDDIANVTEEILKGE